MTLPAGLSILDPEVEFIQKEVPSKEASDLEEESKTEPELDLIDQLSKQTPDDLDRLDKVGLSIEAEFEDLCKRKIEAEKLLASLGNYKDSEELAKQLVLSLSTH